jgi:hypothetical protein
MRKVILIGITRLMWRLLEWFDHAGNLSVRPVVAGAPDQVETVK